MGASSLITINSSSRLKAIIMQMDSTIRIIIIKLIHCPTKTVNSSKTTITLTNKTLQLCLLHLPNKISILSSTSSSSNSMCHASYHHSTNVWIGHLHLCKIPISLRNRASSSIKVLTMDHLSIIMAILTTVIFQILSHTKVKTTC